MEVNMHTRNLATDVKTLQNHLNRRLEPFLERFGFADEDLVSGNWVPPVDVLETPDQIVLRAELPGVRQDAIEISFSEGVLSMRGERGFEKENDSLRYHRIERVYGNFARSFTLPRTVDPERITASFTDGVLEVSVPKRDEAKPRQIRVDVK
jgi:HSP20 family protein